MKKLGFGCMRLPMLENGEVDKVVIQQDGRIEFYFRNGMKCEYPQ